MALQILHSRSGPTGPFAKEVNTIIKNHASRSDVLIISGSHGYNLAHAGSDVDLRGVFYRHSEKHIGIASVETSFSSDGIYDFTAHELNEFVRLMTKCNPNILELVMLLQDDNGQVFARRGYEDMVAFLEYIFPMCLGSRAIRVAYGGFATGQLKRMARYERDDPRRAKLIRHGFRVLDQGMSLLAGEIPNIYLTESQKDALLTYETLSNVKATNAFDSKIEEFDSMTTALPEENKFDRVASELIQFRKQRDFT